MSGAGEGGYIGYVLHKIEGELVPEEPWVYRVIEPPGTTADTLTLWDRSKTIARAGLTVFATEQEAREDARRRIDEVELANFIHAELQKNEAVAVPVSKLAGAFAPGEGVEGLSLSSVQKFAAKYGWQVTQGGPVVGSLIFYKQNKGEKR